MMEVFTPQQGLSITFSRGEVAFTCYSMVKGN